MASPALALALDPTPPLEDGEVRPRPPVSAALRRPPRRGAESSHSSRAPSARTHAAGRLGRAAPFRRSRSSMKSAPRAERAAGDPGGPVDIGLPVASRHLTRTPAGRVSPASSASLDRGHFWVAEPRPEQLIAPRPSVPGALVAPPRWATAAVASRSRGGSTATGRRPASCGAGAGCAAAWVRRSWVRRCVGRRCAGGAGPGCARVRPSLRCGAERAPSPCRGPAAPPLDRAAGRPWSPPGRPRAALPRPAPPVPAET